MSRSLRVRRVQLSVSTDVVADVSVIRKAVLLVIDQQEDIFLLPEGRLSGNTPLFDRNIARKAFGGNVRQADGLQFGVTLGTCWKETDENCHTWPCFYQKDGACLGFQSGTLTCGTMTTESGGEIRISVFQLLHTFAFQWLTVGRFICNEMWPSPIYTSMSAPHLTDQLATIGACVIFHAASGSKGISLFSQEPVKQYHCSKLLLRVEVFRLWFVTVNSGAPADSHCLSSFGVIASNEKWLVKFVNQGGEYFIGGIAL